MTKPVFRNPDKVQVLPWRDWMRENMPPGNAGFVAEDLDLVVLRFGPLEGRKYDEDGRFMLVEIKQMGAGMAYAQQRVFGLIDRLLRIADPHGNYYLGFYLANWADDSVRVNGEKLSMEEFRAFLLGQRVIAPMFAGAK